MSLIYFVSLLTNCHSAQANSRDIHHYIKTVTAAYAKILKLAMSDHGVNISVSTAEKHCYRSVKMINANDMCV